MVGDQGTHWHPANPEAYNADGNLRDLTDLEVAEHRKKPEATRHADATRLMEAEDSADSPEDAV
jgi:hypothetical protein